MGGQMKFSHYSFYFFIGALITQGAFAGNRTQVSSVDFFERIKGDYEIQMAGGKATKYPKGKITLDRVEAVARFPYCPEGGSVCDSGYVFFPLDPATATKVEREDVATDHKIFHIEFVDDMGDKIRSQWVEKGSETRFRRLEYLYDNQPPFDLEFLIQKK